VPPGSLEFRLMDERGAAVAPGASVEMIDTAGKPVHVERTPIVSADDIEGILVEKTEEGGAPAWRVSFDFRRTSWGAIRNATRRAIGRRVVLIHDGKILAEPVIRGAVTTEAQAVAPDAEVPWLRRLLGSLKRGEIPASRAQRKETYREMLVKMLVENPKDVEALDELAAEYIWAEEFDRALDCLENLVRVAPSRAGRLHVLVDRFEAEKAYDKALRCLRLLRQAEPMSSWSARYRAAKIYKAQGDRASAAVELESGLQELRNCPLLPSRRTELITMLTRELETLK